jgi:hypothetical protein
MSRLKENIKIDLREIRCEDVDWIQLAQDRVQFLVLNEHGHEISGSVKAENVFVHLSIYQVLKRETQN